jgi:hypothetical protein
MNMIVSRTATRINSRAHNIKTFHDDDWLELLLQVKASELSGAAKLVGTCIALHLDIETGRCERSSELIADDLGMNGRSVRRMIRKLEAAGWLGVDRTLGFYANSFELSTPDGTNDPAAATSEGGHANV